MPQFSLSITIHLKIEILGFLTKVQEKSNQLVLDHHPIIYDIFFKRLRVCLIMILINIFNFFFLYLKDKKILILKIL